MDPDGREDDNLTQSLIGIYAHIEIEKYLIANYGGAAEGKVKGGGENGKDGRFDYKRDNEIYEIKPITQNDSYTAKLQLQ